MKTILQRIKVTFVISKLSKLSPFSLYLSYILCFYVINYLVGYQEVFHVFYNILKKSCISDIEYNLSGNLNLSFHVGADILNLLLLYDFFIFSGFYNATQL